MLKKNQAIVQLAIEYHYPLRLFLKISHTASFPFPDV